MLKIIKINKPYYAFDPNESNYLFERTFIFDSQQALFEKIPRIIHHLYLSKYAFIMLACSVVAFILVTLLFSIFFNLINQLS